MTGACGIVVDTKKEVEMMKRELLDNGNIWQKSDGRWIGMVRYKDEFGVAQRKSFSSKKKKTLQAKMTEYVKNFNEQVSNSDEARKPLKESMKNWLRVYKFPEVERTTYDRYECTAEHQIYPYIGNKPVGDVTPADIRKLLTKHMNAGYAFTTSKKAYSLLKMFFKQLYQEGAIPNWRGSKRKPSNASRTASLFINSLRLISLCSTQDCEQGSCAVSSTVTLTSKIVSSTYSAVLRKYTSAMAWNMFLNSKSKSVN